MNWKQVREQYPHQWVLAETMEGHTENDRWCVDELTVVDVFAEVSDALSLRKELHKKAPTRDYFVFHTDKKRACHEGPLLAWGADGDMNITIVDGLPFVSVDLAHHGHWLTIADVLLDSWFSFRRAP